MKLLCNPPIALGEKRYHLQVLGPFFRVHRRGGKSEYMCVCQCDCGRMCVKRERDFRMSDRAKVCSNQCHLKDYKAIDDTTRRLRKLWSSICFRCHNPNSNSYANYGGRGISVCDHWRSDREAFVGWCKSNGWKPGRQIDRIDNDGPYSPSNCRFVDRTTNANNKRSNILLTLDNETKTAAEWCRDDRIEVSSSALYERIRKGWSDRDALTKPMRVW